MTGMRYGIGFSYNKTQGVMKGSDRDVLNGNVRLMYRYKTVAFTNYLNLDYTMSSRENVSFSEFSRAKTRIIRKLNEYGEPDQVMETYTDSDVNSSSYLKTLNVYNPLFDMILNSSNESRSSDSEISRDRLAGI